MKPIRVLQILHSMNRGGAENALMNYYREIDREKVQFDFLLTDQNHCQFEEEILQLGGRVFRVPPLRMKNPLPYINGVWNFLRIHKNEYKIVHSHTSSKSVLPLGIAKIAGIPIRISHSHCAMSEKGIKGMVRNALMPLLKITANVCMSCGEQAAEWLYGKKFAHSGNVQIIRNVINAELFKYNEEKRISIRQMLNINDDAFVVGHVARFSPQKNHIMAIDVFNELLKINPKAIYLMVGDGELHDEVVEKIKSLGITESVRMVGVVPNVFDYEQAMDIFVLPSLYEGLPLSIIEAQVSGLPCITTEGTVSKECSVTDLVRYISLSNSPSDWASAYNEARNVKRVDRFEEIKSAGYDSKTSAQILQRRYLELYKR